MPETLQGTVPPAGTPLDARRTQMIAADGTVMRPPSEVHIDCPECGRVDRHDADCPHSDDDSLIVGSRAKTREAARIHQLPGRHTHDPDSPHFLRSRRVDLDEWSSAQIKVTREYLHGEPAASLGYRGTQKLTAQAARTYCGKAVNAAVEAAGLHGVWGLSIGSLGLWRLTYTALHDGEAATARRYGARVERTIDKLLRQLSASVA